MEVIWFVMIDWFTMTTNGRFVSKQSNGNSEKMAKKLDSPAFGPVSRTRQRYLISGPVQRVRERSAHKKVPFFFLLLASGVCCWAMTNMLDSPAVLACTDIC